MGAICFLFIPRAASAGTEGAAFLEIPVGAEPAAMGSAYAALAVNAYAPVWNPAGLAFSRGIQFAGEHLAYLDSVHDEFASVAVPLGMGRALAGSLQYIGAGDIAGTNSAGISNGNFSTYAAVYSLAYGQKLTDRLGLGFTGKAIQTKIAEAGAHAFAGDFGALYYPFATLGLAFTVTNAGTTLKFIDQPDSLPLSYHAAIAYRPVGAWTLSVQATQMQNGQTSAQSGAEWHPTPLLALRTGYRTDTMAHLSPVAGLSAGLGLQLWDQEFSYAWIPYGALGDTQYFSLLLKFGGDAGLVQFHEMKKSEHAKAGAAPDPEDEQLMEMLNQGRGPEGKP